MSNSAWLWLPSSPCSIACSINAINAAMALKGMLPVELVGLMVGRDLAIIAGVMYSRALTIEGDFTLKKYFSVSSSTPQNLKPTNISKVPTESIFSIAMVRRAIYLSFFVLCRSIQCFNVP